MLVNVHGNTGTIDVQMSRAFTGDVDTFNVFGNSGVLNFDYATEFPTNHLIAITHRINVLANAGTINSTDSVTNAYTGLNTSTFSAQVNVGTDGVGGVQDLSNVHGTINLLGENGYQSLNIDDRSRPGTSPSWLIASKQTQIGDLTINYDQFGVGFQAFWKTGAAIAYRDVLQFLFKNLNGLDTYPNFPLDWNPPALYPELRWRGRHVQPIELSGHPSAWTDDLCRDQFAAGVDAQPDNRRDFRNDSFNTYAARRSNADFGNQRFIHPRVDDRMGCLRVRSTSTFPISSRCFPIRSTLTKRSSVTFDPISVNDGLNRTPVVTVTGLPAGLAFNPNTGVISGTAQAGTSTHGPYEVHVHADDGLETNDIALPMIVSGIQLASTPVVRLNHNSDVVDFNLNATTTSGGTLTYSATGLPAGISLNSATGQISGTLAANADSQAPYFVEVTYEDGYSTKSSYLTWTVLQVGVEDQISFSTPTSQSSLVRRQCLFFGGRDHVAFVAVAVYSSRFATRSIVRV